MKPSERDMPDVGNPIMFGAGFRLIFIRRPPSVSHIVGIDRLGIILKGCTICWIVYGQYCAIFRVRLSAEQ